jgi:hypothetical protein
VDSKAGVLDAEGGSPDSGGTAEAAAAAAARMAELKVGLRILIRIGSFQSGQWIRIQEGKNDPQK